MHLLFLYLSVIPLLVEAAAIPKPNQGKIATKHQEAYQKASDSAYPSFGKREAEEDAEAYQWGSDSGYPVFVKREAKVKDIQ